MSGTYSNAPCTEEGYKKISITLAILEEFLPARQEKGRVLSKTLKEVEKAHQRGQKAHQRGRKERQQLLV
jgi:hypothetical protein